MGLVISLRLRGYKYQTALMMSPRAKTYNDIQISYLNDRFPSPLTVSLLQYPDGGHLCGTLHRSSAASRHRVQSHHERAILRPGTVVLIVPFPNRNTVVVRVIDLSMGPCTLLSCYTQFYLVIQRLIGSSCINRLCRW